MDLPVDLWILVLKRLPVDADSLARHRAQASRVSKALRDADRACECRVVLKLTARDKHAQLRAFAAWGRARTEPTTLELRSRDTDLRIEHGLLSLACLASVPTLVCLMLNVYLPTNYATLASCTALRELRVIVPRVRCLKYDVDEDPDDFSDLEYDGYGEYGYAYERRAYHRREMEFVVCNAVADTSSFAVHLALLHLLDAGLRPLSLLRCLDLSMAVPPRGDVVVNKAEVPLATGMPWLTALTQLMRLRARVGTMSEGVWGLPRLQELTVCGGYRARIVGYPTCEMCLGFDPENLVHTSPHLTRLAIDSCAILGKRFVLKPSVTELRLINCISLEGRPCVQLSGPGLTRVTIKLGASCCYGGKPADLSPDLQFSKRLRVVFEPLPHLLAFRLEDRDRKVHWKGVEDKHVRKLRQCRFTLKPDKKQCGVFDE